jgi:hypothetical protein
MQELFRNSNADGSLAMDAANCMNDTQDDEDNDLNDDICNDFSNYAQPQDDLGDDSDTLPSPTNEQTSFLSQTGDGSSSSSGMKRPRAEGKPAKRDVRPKSRLSKIEDTIATTLVTLQRELKKPAPAPPHMPNSDAILWQRLENMTLTTDQKLMVGTFLAHKYQKGMRGFLSGSAEMSFASMVSLQETSSLALVSVCCYLL